jgi:AcrR family transcriptional regulator
VGQADGTAAHGGGTALDAATTARVLAAATELLAREGPARTTLKWVALEAGADPAAVAERWPTMDDLVGWVLDHLAGDIERRVPGFGVPLHEIADDDLDHRMDLFNRIVARGLLDGVNTAELQSDFPLIERLVRAGLDMGMDERTARYKVLECYAIEWGWKLFGPHLVVACGLADEPIDAVRAEVSRLEARLATLPPVPPAEPRAEPPRAEPRPESELSRTDRR